MERDFNPQKKVLFVCTHNSARSQMAEGLLNSRYAYRYNASSAGTEPSEVHPLALRVMEEMGIDISHQKSKNIADFRGQRFDMVITVCDHTKETCPFFPANIIIHKGFEDPSRAEGTEEERLAAFRKSRDEIKEWIEKSFRKEADFRNPVFSVDGGSPKKD